MKRTNIQSGQITIQETMNYTEATKSDAIKERKADIYQAGVLKNSQQVGELEFQFVIDTDTHKLNIKTGVAYNNLGDRILFDAIGIAISYNAANPNNQTDNGLGALIDTPQSTGSKLIDYTSYASSTRHIWVGYMEQINNTSNPGTFSLHRITNAKLFTQVEDGFIVYPFHTSPTSQPTPHAKQTGNSIYLGYVTINSSGIITDVFTTGRTYSKSVNERIGININSAVSPTTYADGDSKFLDDHINALGSGTVSATNPHAITPADIGVTEPNNEIYQQETHANGIITPNPATVDYALRPSSSGGTVITIRHLNIASSGLFRETLYLDGQRFTSDNSQDELVEFSSLSDGSYYYIYTTTTLTSVTPPAIPKLIMSIASETEFLAWTATEKRQKYLICKVYKNGGHIDVADVTDYRHFLFPVRTSIRTYTGHADISNLMSEKLYVHIEGILQRARLYVWAETFDKHHYSELPYHRHTDAHTHSGTDDAAGSHRHDIIIDNNDVATNTHDALQGSVDVGDANARFWTNLARSPGADQVFDIGPYAHSNNHWYDFSIDYSATHQHTFTTGSQSTSVTGYAGINTPSIALNTIERTLITYAGFQIWINGVNKTSDFTEIPNPIVVGQIVGASVTPGVVIAGQGHDIASLLILGENIIEFQQVAAGTGGRIRYNLYLE